MNPWELKRLIEYCYEMAEQCHFKLVRDTRHAYDEIALHAIDTDPIWAKDMTLETFKSWEQCMSFLAGYRKAMMYVASKGTWK